jgi:hypothetical protein
MSTSESHQSSVDQGLPNWYSERYNEDGDTIWIPALKPTWELPDLTPGTMEVTRGQARAAAASEMGEPFTNFRVRRVWMAPGAADFEGGWCEDMAWECEPEDHAEARPYWRVDYAPPKRCSRCSRVEKACVCGA